jgi:hypothetical protein
MNKTLVVIIVFLMLILPSVLVVQSVNNLKIGDDEPVVEITRPEHGYIYVFDHKTIPYGFPLILKPSSTDNAYAFGRPTITIEVKVKQEYVVDYVLFKVVERTLFSGEVDIVDYKDYEEPYQFKFTRITIFPYKNYNVYVDAIDPMANVIGSDRIGLGYYRVYPQIMLFLISLRLS